MMILFLLLFLSDFLYSQNLIPNPSFEDINVCIKYKKECTPQGWRNVLLREFQFPRIKPNHINPKAPRAFKGERIVKMPVYNSGYEFDRTLIQTPLLCELKKGKSYKLTFHYMVEARTIKDFGIIFSDSIAILKGVKPLAFRDMPTDGEVRIKTEEPMVWQKAELVYTARGGEQAMIIGNFKSDENTKIKIVREKKKREVYQNRIKLWLDEFSLVPLDGEIPCENIEKNRIEIYRDSIRHTHARIQQVRDFKSKRKEDSEENSREIILDSFPELVLDILETETIVILQPKERLSTR
ncbi:MAG: hypothetical protein ACPG5P_03425, partial [Saprospiraceae bacterium]